MFGKSWSVFLCLMTTFTYFSLQFFFFMTLSVCGMPSLVREPLIRVYIFNDALYVTFLFSFFTLWHFLSAAWRVLFKNGWSVFHLFNDDIYVSFLFSFLLYGIFCPRHAEFSSRTAPCLYIWLRHLSYFSLQFFYFIPFSVCGMSSLVLVQLIGVHIFNDDIYVTFLLVFLLNCIGSVCSRV